MNFYTSDSDYTHEGSFYGVPIYLNLENEEEPVIEGTNIITDGLFEVMIVIHKSIIEPMASFLASIRNQTYEPHFQFKVKYKLK